MNAAGITITTPDGLTLFLKRGPGGDHAGTWAWPGGGIEDGETPEQAARREALEEIGYSPEGDLSELDHEENEQGAFTTFHHGVAEHFLPKLNSEHSAYAWAPLTQPPVPLHPGVKKTIKKIRQMDMATDADFEESKHPRDHGKFTSGGGSSGSKIDVKSMKKQGGKLGSNEGGVYSNGEGEKFYVKKPSSKAHVENEKTAARLYQLAGVNTLDYVDAGPDHVATKWEKLDKNNISDFTLEEKKAAQKDFAIHAWLSNWDAAGLGGDNQGIRNGKPATLDVGGSLRYRAQGGPKGAAFGNKVGEIDTLRDKNMNPDNAKLFGSMSDADLKSSVERVTSIPNDKIREAVGDDKELADTLIARKNDMAKRFGKTTEKPAEKIVEKSEQKHATQPLPDKPGSKVMYDWSEGEIRVERKADGSYYADTGEFDMIAPDAEGMRAKLKKMGATHSGWGGSHDGSYAFDRASVRRTDVDGRLHVEATNISKANVCPYLGREIPDFVNLGLDADKVYKLYRDPDELEKAAPTFNNIPVLSKHVEVNAEDHRPDLLIGTTGDSSVFEHPYLRNSLAVWTQEAIDDIEQERKKELSSAYRYRADMKSGTSPEGEAYDGVMRDIVGNHVALVEEGRAGPDVVVGDSIEEFYNMKAVSQKAMMVRGALAGFILPRLAADAKMPSLTSILLGVNAKNFAEKKTTIIDAINKAVKGVLAKDASTEGLVALLDGLEKAPVTDEGEPEDDVMLDAEPKELADPGVEPLQPPNPMDAVKAFLEGKLSPEDMAEVEKLCTGGAADDPPPFKGKPEVGGKLVGDEEDDDMKFDKPAMDAAIDKAKTDAIAEVTKTNREIREAERAVRPYIGEVTKAFDSAADVYKATLEALKVDVAGVDPSAYPAMLKLVPVPGAKSAPVIEMGMDAATTADFEKRFPNAARIGSI